jgi:hypothetical protein
MDGVAVHHGVCQEKVKIFKLEDWSICVVEVDSSLL